MDFVAAPGEVVKLEGMATDPDNDELNCNWFVYQEAGNYAGMGKGALDVWQHNVSATSFTVPTDAQEGDYFNLVFEVTDEGVPALTRYAQAIVTVVVPETEEAE